MEAEHYYAANSTDKTKWTVIPYMGRTLSGVTLRPYTEATEDATLQYRFTVDGNTRDSLQIHIIVKSTLDYLNQGGLNYTVKLDDGTPV